MVRAHVAADSSPGPTHGLPCPSSEANDFVAGRSQFANLLNLLRTLLLNKEEAHTHDHTPGIEPPYF